MARRVGPPRISILRERVLPCAAGMASPHRARPASLARSCIRYALLSRYSCNSISFAVCAGTRRLVTMQRNFARRPLPSDEAGSPMLLQFVLLSMLLHVLVVLIFGSATMSGARRGDGWLGPLDVTLRQMSPERGAGFTLAPGADTKLPGEALLRRLAGSASAPAAVREVKPRAAGVAAGTCGHCSQPVRARAERGRAPRFPKSRSRRRRRRSKPCRASTAPRRRKSTSRSCPAQSSPPKVLAAGARTEVAPRASSRCRPMAPLEKIAPPKLERQLAPSVELRPREVPVAPRAAAGRTSRRARNPCPGPAPVAPVAPAKDRARAGTRRGSEAARRADAADCTHRADRAAEDRAQSRTSRGTARAAARRPWKRRRRLRASHRRPSAKLRRATPVAPRSEPVETAPATRACRAGQGPGRHRHAPRRPRAASCRGCATARPTSTTKSSARGAMVPRRPPNPAGRRPSPPNRCAGARREIAREGSGIQRRAEPRAAPAAARAQGHARRRHRQGSQAGLPHRVQRHGPARRRPAGGEHGRQWRMSLVTCRIPIRSGDDVSASIEPPGSSHAHRCEHRLLPCRHRSRVHRRAGAGAADSLRKSPAMTACSRRHTTATPPESRG